MTTFVIIGFFAVCSCLIAIWLSLERVGETLESVAENMKKGGKE